MKIKLLAAAIAALSSFTLANSAQANTTEYFLNGGAKGELPSLLTASDRQYYRSLFGAIDDQNWSRVEALLAERPLGPLHGMAQAEYYLHASSPRAELPRIQNWLTTYRELPQAEQMVNLGLKRGLEARPYLPPEQNFVWQGGAPKRIRPRSIDDGTMPGSIRSSILNRISNDDPDGARQLLDGIEIQLSSAAKAEWRQRVAWSYYIENRNASALAMALRVGEGSGAWVSEGDWVAGLAAWRMGDCETASASFHRAANGAHNPELASAGYYWASRAYVRCRKPEYANELLRGAAKNDQTLYGMLAAEQLGMELPKAGAGQDFSQADWQNLSNVPNVRIAIMLAELGKGDLADEVLRHQARIGSPTQFEALSRLARALGSPRTQLWMAHNAPRGTRADPASRYPVARWRPIDGWKVDPALVYAHALQESNFRPSVVSPAGARGLMQIMPAAARDHEGKIGIAGSARNLNRPEVNLAYGQEHLQMLRRSYATQGQLPKVMAAYNAGLTPMGRWNSEIRDQGDPLLWMESVPYWETRGYVAIVMRNYWMYERQAEAPSASRRALAQGQWPAFPDTSANIGVSQR